MLNHRAVLRLCLVGTLLPLSAIADTVILLADRDATLFEDAQGDRANGAGQFLFAGRTGQPETRRALLHFDLAGVPATAVIASVSLRLNVSRTISGSRNATLHRVLAAWGEGSSNADSQEGNGASSTADDATWLHTFFDSTQWSAAGGDFVASASAARTVSSQGAYTWSSTGLVADVQAWVDDPSSNHGWMLRGDESTTRTAKRFDSREHPTAANRPSLTIQFTNPAVNQAPVVALSDPLPEFRAYAGQSAATVVLATDAFTDDDGDSLALAATSADSAVAVPRLSDNLAVDGIASGQTTITLTATDLSGDSAAVEFSAEVFVIDGDFNVSGAVDFDDFFLFGDHFGRDESHADWDARFDLSGDGTVGFDDFFRFGDSFGLSTADDPLGLRADD